MSSSEDENYTPSTPRVGTTLPNPYYAPTKKNSYVLSKKDNTPSTPRVGTTKLNPYYAPSKENNYVLKK